jgi:hypothetical protein
MSGAAAVMLGIAGCCGFGMWQMNSAIQDAQQQVEQARAQAEAERKARTVEVMAADLLKEFKDDAAAADRKYQGKCLEVSGVVERSGKGPGGARFVVLHAGDDQAPVKVECYFDFLAPEDEVRVTRLDKGDPVTVRGEYSGRVSHIQVRGCALVQ